MLKVKVKALVDARPSILDHAINAGHEYSINPAKVDELIKLGFIEVIETKELKVKIQTK